MKYETIEYICRNYNLLWNLPFRIYRDHELVRVYERTAVKHDFTERHIERLFFTPRHINVLLSPRLMMFALIRDRDSRYGIVIGPGLSVGMSDMEIRSILIENQYPLTGFEEVKKYFNSIKIMPIESFYMLCMTINAQMNDEIVPLETFENEVIPYDVDQDIYQKVVDYLDNREEEVYDSTPYSAFEQKMLFFVKNGMQDQLIEHLRKGYQGRPSNVAFDALRQYKDRCISMTTLLSRAAMEGGLNSDTAYKIFDLYCLKIEQAPNIDTLNLIQGNVLFDFVKRVKECHFGQTANPTINRAIGYINRHINGKLSAPSIASELHISPGYLSVKFKKSVGVSLPNYINQQKVNEAKNLLRFTDRQLIDISNYLSFSSQCYFQNVFKQMTGITPNQYRKLELDQAGFNAVSREEAQ